MAKSRNPIAASLRSRLYRQRVKNAKRREHFDDDDEEDPDLSGGVESPDDDSA